MNEAFIKYGRVCSQFFLIMFIWGSFYALVGPNFHKNYLDDIKTVENVKDIVEDQSYYVCQSFGDSSSQCADKKKALYSAYGYDYKLSTYDSNFNKQNDVVEKVGEKPEESESEQNKSISEERQNILKERDEQEQQDYVNSIVRR